MQYSSILTRLSAFVLLSASILPAASFAGDVTGLCRLRAHAGRFVFFGYTWTWEDTELADVTEQECRDAAGTRLGRELACDVVWTGYWNGTDEDRATIPCAVSRVRWKFFTSAAVSKGTVRNRTTEEL